MSVLGSLPHFRPALVVPRTFSATLIRAPCPKADVFMFCSYLFCPVKLMHKTAGWAIQLRGTGFEHFGSPRKGFVILQKYVPREWRWGSFRDRSPVGQPAPPRIGKLKSIWIILRIKKKSEHKKINWCDLIESDFWTFPFLSEVKFFQPERRRFPGVFGVRGAPVASVP